MANPIPDSRIEEARIAMEGDERRKRRELEGAAMEKRRIDARAAMEGDERRRARQEEEKLKQQRDLAKKNLEEEINKKRAEEQTKAETIKKEATANSEKERAEYEARLKKIKESEIKISSVKKAEISNLSPIRTLKSDIARTVRDEEMSMAKMIIQEKGRAGFGTVAPKKKGVWLVIFLLIVLIASALSAAGLIFYPKESERIQNRIFELLKLSPEAPVVKAPEPTFIINADKKEIINVASLEAEELRALSSQFIKNRQDLGITGLAYLSGNVQLSLKDWQTKLALGMPEQLFGALGSKFMFGVLTTDTDQHGFLILEVKAAPNLGNLLRTWETNIATRVLPLLKGETASTLELFQSRLFHNLEVRTLDNAFGQSELIYAIVGDHHVIITNNEKSLENLIGRLSLL